MTIRLVKRHHPDGFVLWDVLIGGAFMGTVRQQAVAAPSWFVYDRRGEESGPFATRRDAVASFMVPTS